MDRSQKTDVPVLIVGGSLTGLSTALLLGRQGIRSIVVERHAATTVQYKFRGISPRSMEIYRGAGVEDDIRAHRTGDQKSGGIARVKNLADPDVQWMPSPWTATDDLTAAPSATCDQDRLEPILRAHAERLGADVRFNTELTTFEQDEQGVTARLKDRATGAGHTVRAAYLVAADGTDSPTREALGILRRGPSELQHWMNIIFDTDLAPELQGRPLTACFVTDLNGTLVPRDEGRWLLAVQYVPARGERPEDYTPERCRELVRRGAGQPDVKVDLVDARSWEVAGQIADRFRERRVFLVGDAAHVMPPTGGFGGNTGIHDTHNLAWKLASVVSGAADARLLDTYDAERRPVAARTLAQALARLAAWFKDLDMRLPPAEPIVPDEFVIFGYRYASSAILAEEDASGDLFEDPHQPSGSPGTRAPHVEVERSGKRLPIHDLFGGDFVLLAGPGGAAWQAACAAMPGEWRIRCHRITDDVLDLENRWTSAYGVSGKGAVLVRPDGFIAWRSKSASDDPAAALRRAMSQILGSG
jgi:putative polyketide hydroxylase